MDVNIRNLLNAASKSLELGKDANNNELHHAFEVLRNVAENRPALDAPESFSQDLFVLCAEVAFQHGEMEMSQQCLNMFFMKTPPTNQFLCRAYLCQAQLLAPNSADSPEQLEKAVVYLLKSINMAKNNPRYHFLVYNASVLYWQFCRPFLKPNYRQYLAHSMHQVVKALDDIDDKDHEWRGQLMIALIECHVDAGRVSDASHVSTAAATFIKLNVPHLYKQLFGLMIKHQLVDTTKLHKDIKTSAELSIYYRICRLKLSIENEDPSVNVLEECNRIYNMMMREDDSKDRSLSVRDHSPSKTSKSRPITPGSPTKGEDSTAPPSLPPSASLPAQLDRQNSADDCTIRIATPTGSLTNELCTSAASSVHSSRIDVESTNVAETIALSGTLVLESELTSLNMAAANEDDTQEDFDIPLKINYSDLKSPASKNRRTPTPTSVKKLSPDSPEKPFLLLELCRLCLDLNFAELAQKCTEAMKTCSTKNQGFYLEAEFAQCDLMLRLLGNKQENYNKFAVDVRIQAIKKCGEAIMNAIRLGDPNVIQAGCTTQWNLCMPLLQPNLRHHVRRPLTMVSQALEDIQSLLVLMRCQVHMELSKCEEDEEQIAVAIEHVKKALELDDGNIYRERLEVFLHRLRLRSELYKQPVREEDQAATIIEQASKAGSGTMLMKRSLLVKAGQALSPDAFLLVLESESETKEMKGVLTPIKKMAAKAQQFLKSVKKAPGHLKRLGDENDRERARLWADLAKTARKQEVWDVCRVAARFCLLYDDLRWKASDVRSKSPQEKMKANLQAMEGDGGEKKAASRPSSPSNTVPLYDRDLVRILAEVHFINGERAHLVVNQVREIRAKRLFPCNLKALVHLLRGEKVELGDNPIPPVDNRIRPKGYVATKPEDDPDWIEYVAWINYLSKEVFASFIRAANLGVELKEPWIVCNSCVYVWNYTNHILSRSRHQEIVEPLQLLLDCLKKVGHENETTLLVNICVALAFGIIQPWIPDMSSKDDIPTPGKGSPKPKKPALADKSKLGKPQVAVSPDAGPDLKKALDVVEFSMKITNGEKPSDIVPLAVRYPMIQLWVIIKQLSQSAISKALGTDDENTMDGQAPMTRAQVAVEVLSVNNNGIFEFKDVPTVAEAATLMEVCNWSDRLVELQLWARLASLALEQKEHAQVVRCANRALVYANGGTQPKGKRVDPHKYMVEQEMLSYASYILGQSLMDNAMGKNSVRREAMLAFLNSAVFARNAGNYDLVLAAARQYWNCCIPLVGSPVERELLKQPVQTILKCLADTVSKSLIKDREEQEKAERDAKLAEQEARTKHRASQGHPAIEVESPRISTDTSGAAGPDNKLATVQTAGVNQTMIGGPQDDLTLRAALYGVLFQSYADKGDWEESLKVMDQAISDMPRTKHRLLLFKHRVMVKAKLGRNVSMDIQKFKDESEDYVGHMWRKVALCSKELVDQLACYQNAIEALNQPSSDWQKVDYLLEFGQWLFCNEFDLEDALDQVEWAVDILLNMKFDTQEVRSRQRSSSAKGKGKAKKGKGKRVKTPTASATKLKQSNEAAAGSPEPANSVAETEPSVRASDYIPVNKEAIIGVTLLNENLAVTDLSDARQLDNLITCHVILGTIAGRKSENHASYLLAAYGYVIRLWQVTLGASGPVMKEIAKNAAAEAAEQTKGSAKGKGKKTEEKPVKEKPKRKGPLDFIPTTIEEWAVYDAPDELLEACKHEAMKSSGININTLQKPTLTLYYFGVLVDELVKLGYNHLALPVLAMADLISRDLVKSNPFNAAVHMRASEVCLQLNLASGVSFHESLAGTIGVEESEVARSREEICAWKEKLAQVALEEQRIKATLKRLEAEGEDKVAIEKLRKEQEENSTSLHLGQEIGKLSLRKVWTEAAEIAIRQGYYQPAREMLNEALLSAKAFEDKPLIADILYNFAQLSFSEAQFGQAVNLCQEAQASHNGDEMFWYKTTDLSIEAMLADHSTRDNLKTARGMIVDALNSFGEVADERLNKISITGFIMAKLEAKLGSVQAKITFTTQKNIIRPKVIRALKSACDKLDHASELLKDLKYYRDYLFVKKEQAAILTQIAKQMDVRDEKHAHFMMALEILDEATSVAEKTTYCIQTLTSIQQSRNISLPVQREAAELELTRADLMNDILQTWMEEERQEQLENRRKGSIQKTLQEITEDMPEYSDVEKKWMATTELIADQALSTMTKTHSMVLALPHLKARSLFNMGRCLRLLSTKSDPDPPSLWNVDDMAIIKLEESIIQEEVGEGEQAEEEHYPDTTSRHYQRQCKTIAKAKVDRDTAVHYLSQANECLVQAINLSLTHGFLEIASRACQEVLECCGQYDPGMCSQYMALYQSCLSGQYLQNLLERSQGDAATSQLAALIHQRGIFMSTNVTTNLLSGTVYKTIASKLENDWQAWKKISVSPNHLELLKEFPTNFNLVILQHSPDKEYLYGAILDKPKPQAAAAGKNKGLNATKYSMAQNPKCTQSLSKAKVVRIKTDARTIDSLTERFGQHKKDVMLFLLKQEYQRTQVALREKMLANLDQEMKEERPETALSEDTEDEENTLQQQFVSLVEELEAYLAPITAGLDLLFRPPTATSATNSIHGKDAGGSTEAVILMADPMLMELPLEAMSSLQSENIVSLSRDFSLQMLYHRFHQEPVVEETDKKDKKGGGDKNKPPSRIPGLRDASKKQAKIIPLDRTPPPGAMPIDTNNFRYMVDTNLECSETEQHAPIDVFNSVLNKYSQQFTTRWLGVMGNEHVPSVGEWEIYLQEGSAMIFFGMERFMSYIPPSKLVSLNIPDCVALFLFDLAQTSKSFTRQSKADVLKNTDHMELEKPVESVMLSSLTGVKTIVANQWHCTLEENGDKLQVLMQDLLESGKTTGQGVRLLFTPYRRKTEADEQIENEEQEGQAKQEGQTKQEVLQDSVTEETSEPLPSEQVEEEEQIDPASERRMSWFNTVCYGLPNIVVVQM